MATLKEMMAARLAATKKENSNDPRQVHSDVASTRDNQVAPATASASDEQSHPVDQAVRTETVAGERAVVVGAELQSAVAVVLPAARADAGSVSSEESTDNNVSAVSAPEADTDLDVTNPIHFQFLERLQQLQDALLARDPNMKSHLAAIHRTMIEYEELPNLLRPHEIAKIMAAQQSHTNVVLAVATAKKSKAATSKKLSNLSLDDI